MSLSVGGKHIPLGTASSGGIFSFDIKASYALRDAGEALILTPLTRASDYTVFHHKI